MDKITCERCDKIFNYIKTYRLYNEEPTGREVAVCFPCLELMWQTLIKISKKAKFYNE